MTDGLRTAIARAVAKVFENPKDEALDFQVADAVIDVLVRFMASEEVTKITHDGIPRATGASWTFVQPIIGNKICTKCHQELRPEPCPVHDPNCPYVYS